MTAHYAGETNCECERLAAGIKSFIASGLIKEDTQVAYMSGTIGNTGAAHSLEIETVKVLLDACAKK